MRVTLLGTGDAVGVPAPLCDCRYCEESPRRRRPGLLIETGEATVVLDASPGIKEQLRTTGTTTVDAFFVTHHHFDHVGGLRELRHAAMGFDEHVGIEGDYLPSDAFDESEKPEDPEFRVYLTETALDHLETATPHVAESLDVRTLDRSEDVAVDDLCVRPFPVEHGRPQFDTLGFAVYQEDRKLVYAPDMWEFADAAEFERAQAYEDAELLFAEGSALFRAFGHGKETDLRASLADADADRTVLLNLNEHLQRMTTDELRAVAEEAGYEIGSDFAEYEL